MDLRLKPPLRPYFIILGNEKGGTGKSTMAMHLIVQLMYDGFRVGSIDVDGRQGTLSRYVENRRLYVEQTGIPLAVSQHHRLMRQELDALTASQDAEQNAFEDAVRALGTCDFIVVDTPGSYSHLSRLAHSYADTLITPLNDSFIDLELMVRLDQSPDKILHPSTYSEMVWDQRKRRATRDGQNIDWIVMRNRMGHLFTKNKEQIDTVLGQLAKRIGFRIGSGFGERVIFRELFLSGLTLLDLEATGGVATLSHVAARQELRGLMSMISIPEGFQKAG